MRGNVLKAVEIEVAAILPDRKIGWVLKETAAMRKAGRSGVEEQTAAKQRHLPLGRIEQGRNHDGRIDLVQEYRDSQDRRCPSTGR